MKVILNKDLSTLGEEGDVKDVAKGYARNYLFPRGIALPYNEGTVRLFEARKGDIEARKTEKREAAKGLKERIESLELVLTMPAGANGRLFGSVTGQTLADELARQGFQIERKRIELPGSTFKSVGKYKVMVHLYENAAAELGVTVQAQVVEKAPESPSAKGRHRRSEDARTRTEGAAGVEAGAEPTPAPAVPSASAGAVPSATAEVDAATPAPAAPPASADGGEAGAAEAGTGETGSPQS
jgi:large subunit ribosomal protein L9